MGSSKRMTAVTMMAPGIVIWKAQTEANTILGYLAEMIKDELHNGYLICEENGEQVFVDYKSDMLIETNVVTRGMTKKGIGVEYGFNIPARESLPKLLKPTKLNPEEYSKFFPGTNLETLQRTFQAMTQLGTRGAVAGFNLRNRILALNPMLTTPRRNEDVATDTLYSRTPAIDDGSTAAQFFSQTHTDEDAGDANK
jgi:hypothetical protein